jgi:L-lactate utilization protein LutC
MLEVFKQSVESVSAHCIVTTDVADALNQILTDLNAKSIARSDNAPNAHDIFYFDVGISTAQAAIAETGTLVLDSTYASAIVETLGDALRLLQRGNEISPAITFITGPSRTADIELTLAIGVHGPRELYVIVDGSK